MQLDVRVKHNPSDLKKVVSAINGVRAEIKKVCGSGLKCVSAGQGNVLVKLVQSIGKAKTKTERAVPKVDIRGEAQRRKVADKILKSQAEILKSGRRSERVLKSGFQSVSTGIKDLTDETKRVVQNTKPGHIRFGEFGERGLMYGYLFGSLRREFDIEDVRREFGLTVDSVESFNNSLIQTIEFSQLASKRIVSFASKDLRKLVGGYDEAVKMVQKMTEIFRSQTKAIKFLGSEIGKFLSITGGGAEQVADAINTLTQYGQSFEDAQKTMRRVIEASIPIFGDFDKATAESASIVKKYGVILASLTDEEMRRFLAITQKLSEEAPWLGEKIYDLAIATSVSQEKLNKLVGTLGITSDEFMSMYGNLVQVKAGLAGAGEGFKFIAKGALGISAAPETLERLGNVLRDISENRKPLELQTKSITDLNKNLSKTWTMARRVYEAAVEYRDVAKQLTAANMGLTQSYLELSSAIEKFSNNLTKFLQQHPELAKAYAFMVGKTRMIAGQLSSLGIDLGNVVDIVTALFIFKLPSVFGYLKKIPGLARTVAGGLLSIPRLFGRVFSKLMPESLTKISVKVLPKALFRIFSKALPKVLKFAGIAGLIADAIYSLVSAIVGGLGKKKWYDILYDAISNLTFGLSDWIAKKLGPELGYGLRVLFGNLGDFFDSLFERVKEKFYSVFVPIADFLADVTSVIASKVSANLRAFVAKRTDEVYQRFRDMIEDIQKLTGKKIIDEGMDLAKIRKKALGDVEDAFKAASELLGKSFTENFDRVVSGYVESVDKKLGELGKKLEKAGSEKAIKDLSKEIGNYVAGLQFLIDKLGEIGYGRLDEIEKVYEKANEMFKKTIIKPEVKEEKPKVERKKADGKVGEKTKPQDRKPKTKEDKVKVKPIKEPEIKPEIKPFSVEIKPIKVKPKFELAKIEPVKIESIKIEPEFKLAKIKPIKVKPEIELDKIEPIKVKPEFELVKIEPLNFVSIEPLTIEPNTVDALSKSIAEAIGSGIRVRNMPVVAKPYSDKTPSVVKVNVETETLKPDIFELIAGYLEDIRDYSRRTAEHIAKLKDGSVQIVTRREIT